MSRLSLTVAARALLLATMLGVSSELVVAQDSRPEDGGTTTISSLPVAQRPRLAVRDFQFQAQMSREDQAELNGYAGLVYVLRGGNPQATAESNATNLAKSTSQLLTERLQTSRQFRVFEREQLSSVMAEEDLVSSDRAERGQNVAKTGALLGAKYVVTGAITKFGKSKQRKRGVIGGIMKGALGGVDVMGSKTDYEVGITVKVIDASTGEVMAAATTEGAVTGDTERRLAGLAGTWGAIGAGMFEKSATGEREKRITEALQRAIDLIVVKLIEARERGELTT